MVSTDSNAMLIAKLDRVEKLLASQELKTTLRGSDVDIVLRRTKYQKLCKAKIDGFFNESDRIRTFTLLKIKNPHEFYHMGFILWSGTNPLIIGEY